MLEREEERRREKEKRGERQLLAKPSKRRGGRDCYAAFCCEDAKISDRRRLYRIRKEKIFLLMFF